MRHWQAQANELQGIEAEFYRTAADRAFIVQKEVDKYLICTLGRNS